MKKTIFCWITLCLLFPPLFAQTSQPEVKVYSNCVTFGVFQGGGSLLGLDLEFAVTQRFSFQLGAGFIGFGAGLNYHLKPTLRSSFLSLQYWNQGTGRAFVFNAVGPSFVLRGKKWFTAQLGLGFPISYGPSWNPNAMKYPVILMYSIGAYIPF